MNVLQIALTTQCNFACPTCPMAKWRTTEPTEWGLTNLRLIPYLYKHVDPSKWLIEFTGGEPALYEGLEELLTWCDNHQYRGLIKTNGSLPIAKHPNFLRVAAFHKLAEPPKYYDKILIIYGLQHNEKVEYCKRHHLDYRIIGFNKDRIDSFEHHFERVSFINPTGQVLACPACIPNPMICPRGDLATVDFAEPKTHEACSHCKFVIDFERFLPDKWK